MVAEQRSKFRLLKTISEVWGGGREMVRTAAVRESGEAEAGSRCLIAAGRQ